jgi:hypothetical protein
MAAFPRKHSARGASQPITGELARIRLEADQAALVENIVIGLFLDMQDKPLTDILTACYLTGANHAICAQHQPPEGSKHA